MCSGVLLGRSLGCGALRGSLAGRVGCSVLLSWPGCPCLMAAKIMTGCTVQPRLPRLRLVTWAGGGTGRQGARFTLGQSNLLRERETDNGVNHNGCCLAGAFPGLESGAWRLACHWGSPVSAAGRGRSGGAAGHLLA